MSDSKRKHIALSTFDDKELKENCGIFAIYHPDEEVARIIFFALYALQHRGQEGAGITTVGKHGKMSSHRGMGLAMQIFTEKEISQLRGHLGIGHARYSTAGGSNIHNSQPFVVETHHGAVAIAHNGQLALANKLRIKLMQKGVGLFTSNDSEVIAQMFAAQPDNIKPEEAKWEKRFQYFMQEVEGAYSICVVVKDAIFGIRDRFGLRPLCIGSIKIENNQNAYVLSSESCALTTIGATLIRDVYPGEIVRIDKNGLTSIWGVPPTSQIKPAFCVFEYVYFARPDSVINGVLVHSARQQLGRQLAREAPCPSADVVIGVPDSSIPMAIGYSQESGIPFTEGLCKNRYIGRTFIQPSQEMRLTLVKLKYNPLVQNLEGKNVVMVDDSLVRGNTISQIISLVRSAGVKSIHVRIASPPIRHPCYMGIDMKTKEELIAGHQSIEDITKMIGADSLCYLSHEGMISSIRALNHSETELSNSIPKKEDNKPITPPTNQKGEINQPDLSLTEKNKEKIDPSHKETQSVPPIKENVDEKTQQINRSENQPSVIETQKDQTTISISNISSPSNAAPNQSTIPEKQILNNSTPPISNEKPKDLPSSNTIENQHTSIQTPSQEIPKTDEILSKKVISPSIPIEIPTSHPIPTKEDNPPSTIIPPNPSSNISSTSSPLTTTSITIETPPKENDIDSTSTPKGFCSACFTGHYPLDIEDITYSCGLDL